jgi:type I restriction enzyme M protein
MLDQVTKKKIDDARNILVGKVTDPKTQIEQITLAMTYKLVNDMDRKALNMGGKASYFIDDYEQFSWDSIIDTRISGQERMNRYDEGLHRMSVNPNLPELFRNVFKNAFLPYKDPPTLNMFLEEINGFDYSDYERLGDGYEYLLSVMGSQGKAGQFRTPRHIIDFIVDVVKPQKTDRILDPACGTAGFLISAIKHIFNENTKDNYGDLINIDEKQNLANSVFGYDIDPGMVRICLVNMFLHEINQPHIYEYDSLSSLDRWDENFSCILANPPFMTPTGGIKPHNRFGIPSKRSEVLFVDYIMEHLALDGKAGVIIPEGIIFKKYKDFKKLRIKMVDENFLWAVVSLPAGVFNPYSGVKTSILFFDREITKHTDNILFVKVETDGYDLGDQRKPIDKDDLPNALYVLNHYNKQFKQSIEKDVVKEEDLYKLAHTASKEIIRSEDYNLDASKYVVTIERKGHWQNVLIDDIIKTIIPPKKIQQSEFQETGKYPIIDQSQNYISGWSNDESAVIIPQRPYIIFGDHTCAIKYVETPFIQGADGIKIIEVTDSVLPKYLYYYLLTTPIISDGYKRHFSKLKETKIPLPPIDVQKEIVAEIEGYQKIIDGAKLVIDNWKPRINIDPGWEEYTLKDVAENITDGSHFSPPTVEKGYPYITVRDIVNDEINFKACKYIDEKHYKLLSKANCHPKTNDVLFSKDGTVGKVALVGDINEFVVLSSLAIIRPNVSIIIPKYLYYVLRSDDLLRQALLQKKGVAIRRIVLIDLKTLKIRVPNLEIQSQVVAKIEEEQAQVDGCKKLIEMYQQKIKERIDRVWGE